jgi:FkbM family methyltransferase
MLRKQCIHINYYIKRAYQKLINNNFDFAIPFRKSGQVYVSNPPGTVLKFAKKTDANSDLELIINKLNKSDVYFDVGANFGHYSLSVHDNFDAKIEIHCFEPEQDAYRRLIQNCKLNKANWNCNNFALGEEESWTYVTRDLGGFNHIVNDSSKGQLSRVLKLDQYCEAADVDKIDLLKIDVEGFEIFVLKGATDLLSKKKIKKIIFEVDDHQSRYGVTLEDYEKLLTSYGYTRPLSENGNFQFWELS